MSDQPENRLPPYRVSLARTLLAAREAVMAPIRPMLREANVTEQQWRVLRVLIDANEEALDAQTLASSALLHAPSVTRIIRELDARGLIRVCTDAEDGRRRNLSITPAGRDLVEATQGHTMSVFRSFSASFGSERLEALRQEIAEFTRAIEQRTDDP